MLLQPKIGASIPFKRQKIVVLFSIHVACGVRQASKQWAVGVMALSYLPTRLHVVQTLRISRVLPLLPHTSAGRVRG